MRSLDGRMGRMMDEGGRRGKEYRVLVESEYQFVGGFFLGVREGYLYMECYLCSKMGVLLWNWEGMKVIVCFAFEEDGFDCSRSVCV